MRLIRRQDRERLGISFRNIESPFFAKVNVERALHLPHTSLNLFHVDAFGRPMSEQQIVEAVENDDFCEWGLRWCSRRFTLNGPCCSKFMYFTWLAAICGVAVVGAGSLASGIVGGVAGELAGDVIYEIVK